MYKSSRFIREMNCVGTPSLTPIRDYDNDYFHSNDDKLPGIPMFPYKNDKDSSLPAKNKRPASLELLDNLQCVAKKQHSPAFSMSMENSAGTQQHDPVNIAPSLQSPKVAEFFNVIRRLYESETEYADQMELSNSVYRKELNEKSSFRNKLVKLNSREETFIFGNIETMSSISRLFLTSMKDALLNNKFKDVNIAFWNNLKCNKSLRHDLLEQFDIGKVFHLNFLRVKSTYLTYFVTHRKQMEFYDLMKVGNEQLFRKWYDHCFKLANMQKLEDIFERPIRRLSEWTTILKMLRSIAEGQGIVGGDFLDNICNTHDQYHSFERYIEDEISEFSRNPRYDFSLTPVEIIESYEIGKRHAHRSIGVLENEAGDNFDEKESQVLTIQNFERITASSMRTTSVFSKSSSRYSAYDIKANSEQHSSPATTDITNAVKTSSSASEGHILGSLTLADHIENFKKTHKDLLDLKRAISKDDMLGILDVSLRHAETWKNMIDCLPDDGPVLQDDPELFITSMYNAYIAKLRRLREEAAVMKSADMQAFVHIPLASLLERYASVSCRIRDLNVLKRDYLTYLKDGRSSIHDLKKDILADHFEKLQDKLLHELPIFLGLVFKMITLIVLNYHKILLKCLELSAGGESFLIRDLEILGNLKKDAGKNFDILRSYSASRFCSKRYVRDNWDFKQGQMESKVLRRLFEL